MSGGDQKLSQQITPKSGHILSAHSLSLLLCVPLVQHTMPKRKKSAANSIANLGSYARKLPRLEEGNQENVSEYLLDHCTVPLTTALSGPQPPDDNPAIPPSDLPGMQEGPSLPLLTPDEAREHAAKTLAEISKPTWSTLLQASSDHPPPLRDAPVPSGMSLPSQSTSIGGQDQEEDDPAPHGPPGEHDTPSDTDSGSETEDDGPACPDTMPPQRSEVQRALVDITNLLRPPRKNGKGHKPFTGDDQLQRRLEMVQSLYSRFLTPENWIGASLDVVRTFLHKPSKARTLRRWAREYLVDRTLPTQAYGTWTSSVLENDELQQDLCTFLQSKGKYIRAQDVIGYLGDPEVQARFGVKKGISLATGKWWMKILGYQWGKGPTGQYIDGHECADVVAYHQQKFLPLLAALDHALRTWTHGGPSVPTGHALITRPTVLWYHDESVFSGNDRRKVYWVPKGAKAVPQPKGEGPTLMVADFVSADYGWLRSPDGLQSARVIFRPGKNRDGYFDNDDILKQVTHALKILHEYFPDEDHVFIFDNATTHRKRPADALSARRMSKAPTAPNKPLFGVDVPVLDDSGNPVHDTTTGKVLKTRARMADATLPDGSPQSLYTAEDEERPGVFKGMERILVERGYDAAAVRKLRAECPKFDCPTVYPQGTLACCCRRLLYNEPDFAGVESILESHCRKSGVPVIFLPKFHCELNPIESCWGYAKKRYRELPASTGRGAEADLERNVLKVLDEVPLESIRR